MKRYKDLSGRKFGRLTVEKYIRTDKNYNVIWLCKCDCGKELSVIGHSLVTGNTKSCGCLHREAAQKVGKAKKTCNSYEERTDFIIGKDNSGNSFIVDKEDRSVLTGRYWRKGANGYFYDVTDGKAILLHRHIMSPPADKYVDHINHDPSDNRRRNLRICDPIQNSWSHVKSKNNTSGHAGVYFIKRTKRWEAALTCDGIRHRKAFEKKEDAINQRQEWEQKYFGEFALAK